MLSRAINPGKITQPLRALGLMHVVDKLKFNFQRLKNNGRNKAFKLNHPGVALPPDYMLFESFKLDYDKYYVDGLDSAKWLINTLSPYIEFNGKKILDWGCGPARMVRHLPALLPGNKIYGTDYNPHTIEWCKQHIPSVQFSINKLNPPLDYPADFFDAIYGISIFTHLSAKNHLAWYNELIRITAPGGILLLTTHGDAFKVILTYGERNEFEDGQLIIRAKAKEGHRVFTAFHPPAYMKHLFETKCQVLKHIPGIKKDWGIEQDTWILKKEERHVA